MRASTIIIKNRAGKMVKDLTDYINKYLVDDGNTEEKSQRICVINAIKHLDATITGIEDSDIKIREVIEC